MKKMLVLLAFLLDGLAVGLIIGLLLPTEKREELSRKLAVVVAEAEANMPDG